MSEYQGSTPAVNDSGSIGWGVLGFFLPVVGLILWIVWRETKPKDSKMARNGFIIGIVVQVVIWIIYSIVIASVIANAQ